MRLPVRAASAGSDYGAPSHPLGQWVVRERLVAGVTLKGEMRMLRTIIHVVIKHMAAQLQAPTPA